MNNPRRSAYRRGLSTILLILALFGLAEGCRKPPGPEGPELTPAERADMIAGWQNKHSSTDPGGALEVWTFGSLFRPSDPIGLRLRLAKGNGGIEGPFRASVEVGLRPVATENLLRKATFDNAVWTWKKDFMAWEAVIKDVFAPAEPSARREALAEGQYVLDVVITPLGKSPIDVKNIPIEVLFVYAR